MDENPYKVRPDLLSGPTNEVVCQQPLYSLWSVFFATLFGTALAGATLIGLSLIRLGRPKTGYVVVGATAVLIIGLYAGLYRLPDHVVVSNTSIHVPQLICMYLLAKHLYGRELEQRKKANGAISGGWMGIAVGLITVVLIATVFLGVVVMVEGIPIAALFGDLGTEVTFGNDSVFYDDGATQEDAERLAELLKDWELFENAGMEARIRYEEEMCIVSFYFDEDAWNDENAIEYYQLVADALASEQFGSPVCLEICNDNLEAKRTLIGTVSEDDGLK